MHRISSRYHVPKARPSKRKMQALLKAKRWASGQLELEHPSFHDNDPNASGHASSNYEKNAKEKETGVLDITVSFDDLGKKRGYKSLYGIGVVIDLLTGLVIDYEILSKYCTECTAAVRDLSGDSPDFAIWYEGHKSECQINHTGSSSSMEMEAAAILWQRSIKECNMRYTCILSDGDSKTFQHLMSLNIYGKGKPIKKRNVSTIFQAPRNRALANEESPESHSVMKTKLTEEVVAKILPVYQRLASNEILSRCTSGKSQNANESLNSVIWSHCPKESFQSKKRLEISVVTAVSEFNFDPCLP
ncbi:uncharacterized protein TNCV_1495981 [Trichonephila clavipes]|nr:uncharacterized protein TNCV_1495981 [Trichonephila clavipes]